MSDELSCHTNHHSEMWLSMKKVYGPNERPVSCKCNPHTGEKCMFHWDMDEWLLAFTAARQKTESEIQHDEASEADC